MRYAKNIWLPKERTQHCIRFWLKSRDWTDYVTIWYNHEKNWRWKHISLDFLKVTILMQFRKYLRIRVVCPSQRRFVVSEQSLQANANGKWWKWNNTSTFFAMIIKHSIKSYGQFLVEWTWPCLVWTIEQQRSDWKGQIPKYIFIPKCNGNETVILRLEEKYSWETNI